MNRLDAHLSSSVSQSWPSHLRWILLSIEWSIHGIPWLVCSSFYFIYACWTNYPRETQYKCTLVLLGIVFDLISVGLIKLIVRRQRPSYNNDDQVFEAPVADKYSFPSGHTSRAAMLSILLDQLLPFVSIPLSYILHVAPFVVGYSRTALGRHYISDIISGFLLGAIEAYILLKLPADRILALTEYLKYFFQL